MAATTTEQTPSSTEEARTETVAALLTPLLSADPAPASEGASVVSKLKEAQIAPSNDLIRLKPAETSRVPLTPNNIQTTLLKALRGSTFALIGIGAITIVPILQLIVGWRYADECPINTHIPRHLLVAGIAGLSTIILAIIFALVMLYTTSQLKASEARAPSIVDACGLGSILIVLILAVLFLCGWFVTGCYWVLRVWDKVQYDVAYRSDYCHPMLYRIACGLLLASIVSYIFACDIFYRQGRRLLVISRHQITLCVPTTEA